MRDKWGWILQWAKHTFGNIILGSKWDFREALLNEAVAVCLYPLLGKEKQPETSGLNRLVVVIFFLCYFFVYRKSEFIERRKIPDWQLWKIKASLNPECRCGTVRINAKCLPEIQRNHCELFGRGQGHSAPVLIWACFRRHKCQPALK